MLENGTMMKLNLEQRRGLAATAALAVSLLSACGGNSDAPPMASELGAQAKCPTLAGAMVAAGEIGTSARLVSGAATVASAVLVPAKALVMNAAGTAVMTPAVPEYCQLNGTIGATTAGAQPIGFQVNLPTTTWNAKLIQMGGGGLNGSLTTGVDYIGTSTNSGSQETPLKKGYATVGTDSGHLITASARFSSTDSSVRAGATGDFALNDEMLRNFAHESYKKVKDVAMALTARYYGQTPSKVYYIGGSEGGREALIVAQRYAADYDGVFARAPVLSWTGSNFAFLKTAQNLLMNNGAGFLGTADIRLLYRTTLQACDGRDGVVDGVVSNYLGCKPLADPAIAAKLCTGSYTAGSCFTQAQIDYINLLHSSALLPFPVSNGINSGPGMYYGGEAGPSSIAQWRTGAAANLQFGATGMSVALNYGGNAAKFFFARNGDADIATFNPSNYQANILAVSALMDATQPDLSAFNNRNGKIIIVSCTGDAAVSPQTHFDYYNAVIARMGKTSTDNFLRLYVAPSTNHGCGDTVATAGISISGVTVDGAQTSSGTVSGMPVNVDWVALLEDWVEQSKAPGNSVIATANAATAPFAIRAAKPLCHYPLYAKFTGLDAAAAASYSCVASDS